STASLPPSRPHRSRPTATRRRRTRTRHHSPPRTGSVLFRLTSSPTRTGPVRAENRIHGSDQHSCSPGGRPVMITDHVPAVLLPPDHADRRVAAAVPAGGCVEDRRDP